MMEKIHSELQAIANTCGCNSDVEGYTRGSSAFIDFILEDKSKYPRLKDCINPKTNQPFVDLDDDFVQGLSGGILMGIDFLFVGVEVFSTVADYFQAHGKYCPYPEDSNQYKQFWARETVRRRKGAIANCKLYFKDVKEYCDPTTTNKRKKALLHPLRITGDHYNYLNYGRIERVPNDKERAELDAKGLFKVKTVEAFPRFWDGDYWNFKIDEVIANNDYNLCKAKARRKGFSYKRGSQAANTLNLNKNVTVILAAYKYEYLIDKGATTYMAKINLDWFENHTNWRRGFLSETMKNIELGYKKRTQGNQSFGFRSKLLSASVEKNESVLIGKKAIEIDIEEAGKCPNLQEVLDVTKSNMESGSIQIGTLRVYGTAGTKAANWTAFSEAFYNPSTNSMLHMENVWDIDKRHTTCGFFFPQIWCYEPYMHNGNSLLLTSFAKDKEQKDANKLEADSTSHTTYVAQRANTPAEAFINTTFNIFASPELNAHVANVITENEYQFYKDGWYEFNESGRGVDFILKHECIERGIFSKPFHEYIIDVPHTNKTDVHGCVREYYPPREVNGIVPPDEYVCFLDAYRVDKHMDDVTDKHSLYSWQIWSRAGSNNNKGGKRLVAEYAGRLNTMEENDRELLKALFRYNCKVLIEAGTGETVSNFKKWGYRTKLLKDPLARINRSVDVKREETYGIVIGDGDTKYEGIRMLKDFLYEIVGYNEDRTPIFRFSQIYSPSFLLELQRFNHKQNFDRISTAILAMYQFLKDSTMKRTIVTNPKSRLGARILNKR